MKSDEPSGGAMSQDDINHILEETKPWKLVTEKHNKNEQDSHSILQWLGMLRQDLQGPTRAEKRVFLQRWSQRWCASQGEPSVLLVHTWISSRLQFRKFFQGIGSCPSTVYLGHSFGFGGSFFFLQ